MVLSTRSVWELRSEEAMKSDQRMRAGFLEEVSSEGKLREMAKDRAVRRALGVETIRWMES